MSFRENISWEDIYPANIPMTRYDALVGDGEKTFSASVCDVTELERLQFEFSVRIAPGVSKKNVWYPFNRAALFVVEQEIERRKKEDGNRRS
jgi:uncharacterized protein YciW